jgi:hypothetical protein
MAKQIVTLNPNEARAVSFEVVPTLAKVYQVAVDGLTGSFSCMESGAVIWNMPNGIDKDPAAINVCVYPSTAAPVKLKDVDYSMPDNLLIWYLVPGTTDDWLFYIKGWESCTLEYLTPGETYTCIVSTACTWEIPQPQAGKSYNLAAYYAYIPGKPDAPSNYPEWQNKVTTYVQYEADLIASYVQKQGINAGMPLISVEAFELDGTYFTTGGSLRKDALIAALKLLPSWSSSDVQVVLGSADAGTNASQLVTTVFMYLATIAADVKAMEGPGDSSRVYCELAHEMGHVFIGSADNLPGGHCSNKPCPMAQQYITYQEWVNMGKTLWYCDIHKPLLLNKWEQGL